jgi:hypothetical protein
MLSPLRRVARLLVLVCVFACGFGPSSKAAPATRSAEPTDPIASTEVRLRKLHLVRPDLIPYPIAYEVVC